MRGSERLTTVVALALSVIAAAAWPAGAALRLVVFLSMVAMTVLLARAPARRPWTFLRDWLPVGELVVMFLLLQPIIEAVVPWRLDAALAAFDDRYLAWLVTAWRDTFGRADVFSDAVYLAYASYYFLPITVAAAARRRGPAAFEQTVFAILFGFYLTFLGYLLFPASGPRLPFSDEAGELGGGAVSEAVRWFLQHAETTRLDAFPSGHTTIAIVSAVMGSRVLGRTAAAATWLWAVAIVFATVYIHVHYAIDVVAGLALAPVVLSATAAAGPAAAVTCSRSSDGRK